MREPWASFLRKLDSQLTELTELHCFGGFVVAEHYGLTRATADIDVIYVGGTGPAVLSEMAGKGSTLHKKHGVYIDVVTIAAVPEDYEGRLTDLFPDASFTQLRLKGLERHDLALAKLERNSDRDREDVKRLAGGPGLDPGILRERYTKELRFQLGRPEAVDLALDLWVEMIQEVTSRTSG
jgi:hypothetical protein